MQASFQGYRLSSQQQQHWLLHQNSTVYTVQCVALLSGQLRLESLRRALAEVIDRHEILRTAFRFLTGMNVPLQVIVESRVQELIEIDVSRLGEPEQRIRLEELLAEQRGLAFDYEQGQLLHTCLLKLSADNHALVITMPAICADAPTLDHLLHELGERYATRTGDGENTNEFIQYVDFSQWQNELLESEEKSAGREYWRKQTASKLESVQLPSENKPDTTAEYKPESISVVLEQEVQARATALAHKLETDLPSILLACWLCLLRRLTGEAEIVVQLCCNGRKYEDLEGALGLFSKHLPVRCHFEDNLTFRHIARRVQQSRDEALAWMEYFTPEPTNNVAKGTAIGFEYQQPAPGRSFGELTFALTQLHTYSDRFKLKLFAAVIEDELRLELQYDSNFYQRSDIRRLAGELSTLVRSASGNPGAAVGRLKILDEIERQKLLFEWNENATASQAEQCIHVLFEAQVKQTPNNVAVIYEDEEITYAELNAKANRIAHLLRSKDVGPETTVGLLLQRSVDTTAGLLGILKAGGAYVPLDPFSPAERLEFMIADSGMSGLVTTQPLLAPLQPLGVWTLCLDTVAESLAGQGDENPVNETEPENLAYVIYTSGSTGRPKGVIVEHRSVVNLSAALQKAIYIERGPCLKVSVNAPLTFDASVKQIIQLLVGHTLCLIPEEVRNDSKEFLSYIKQHRVEVVDCTPSQMRLLLNSGFLAETDYSPSAVLLGGETLDDGLWQLLCHSRKTDFYNVYGPTECTGDATSYLLKSDRTRPTFGSPLTNVRAYLLDKYLEPVAIGVAGELYLGGAGLSRGYLNQVERTSQMFLPDPFSRKAGERMYKTGDVARYSPDGQMEYLGRTDHQVKIRGYRIELGEIESLLMDHPGVREAVTIVREDTPGDQKLVSYIVLHRQPVASGPRTKYHLPNGMHIACLDRAETDYMYQEIFEEQVYFKHGIELAPEACVFDVGANIGLFTLFIREHYQDADIYAFEPIDPIFKTLQFNTAVYGKDVKLFHFGLAEVEKTEVFAYYPNFSARSGLKEFANASADEEVTRQFLRNKQDVGVASLGELAEFADELLQGKFISEDHEFPVRRLSDVIREQKVERIDLLKVDVQQAELKVLQGISDDDWAKIKQVTMEVHDGAAQASQGRLAKISSLLDKQGFDVVTEQDRWLKGTDRHNVYAIRRESRVEKRHNAIARTGSRRWLPATELESIDAEALRKYLQGKLPHYMLPTFFVFLDRLPLTRNGKVDRQALPMPQEVNMARAAVNVPPQNEMEEVIAAAWQKFLQVENVSVYENFFELGGHSLLMVRVVDAVGKRLNRHISLRDMYRFPTISSLAKYLSEGEAVDVTFDKIQERVAQRKEAAKQQRFLVQGRKHG